MPHLRRRHWISLLALAAVVLIVLAWLLPGHGLNLQTKPQRPSVSFRPLGNPWQGVELFRPETQAMDWQASHRAKWLSPITDEPQAVWLIDPQDLTQKLPELARQAARSRRRLVLVAYYIPDLNCGGASSGAPTAANYRAYITQMIAQLRHAHDRAVIVLEPDSIAAACFDAARAALLKWAVIRLENAGQYVYLDGGHPGWRSVSVMVTRLLESGVNEAQGFVPNVSNYDSLAANRLYGSQVASLIGGNRQFIIDTSRDGLGAPPGNAWCNPARAGLGNPPTTTPDGPEAADLWIKGPGESDGLCGIYHVRAGFFSPAIALQLLRGANWLSAAQKRLLPANAPITAPFRVPLG